jgi:DivIVA domain-containing protein
VAWTSRNAPLVNGDEVRDTWFLRSRGSREGYDAPEVDDLLDRVATELDAGRPARPLIENATFPRKKKGYDVDAVDWFLDQLILQSGRAERAGLSADPWRDLSVTQFTQGGVSSLAGQPGRSQPYFAEECRKAWCDFRQQPGMSLTWGWSGHLQPYGLLRYELRTTEQQMVASGDACADRLRVGERRFTRKNIKSARHSSGSLPGLAEAHALSWRDFIGHFAAGRTGDQMIAPVDSQHVDEAGMPVLYAMGSAFKYRACARIGFPDQQGWLRFLVRGTGRANAIMTAVDQTGNKIARCRSVAARAGINKILEITIHPDQKLTDELVLAIAISAPWLGKYFEADA